MFQVSDILTFRKYSFVYFDQVHKEIIGLIWDFTFIYIYLFFHLFRRSQLDTIINNPSSFVLTIPWKLSYLSFFYFSSILSTNLSQISYVLAFFCYAFITDFFFIYSGNIYPFKFPPFIRLLLSSTNHFVFLSFFIGFNTRVR